jgi:hypothetical protein
LGNTGIDAPFVAPMHNHNCFGVRTSDERGSKTALPARLEQYRPREYPCVWIDALVRCRGDVYYQVDYGAAIGGRYDAPGIYADTYRLKT